MISINVAFHHVGTLPWLAVKIILLLLNGDAMRAARQWELSIVFGYAGCRNRKMQKGKAVAKAGAWTHQTKLDPAPAAFLNVTLSIKVHETSNLIGAGN